MNILGIDVGGANLKFANLHQQAMTLPFPLWKSPEQLEQQIVHGIELFGPADIIALTMTGELADCFDSKAEGVRFITEAVDRAAAEIPVLVWQTAGEFVLPEIAIEFPTLTAAANWHALATWAARMTLPDQSGLLLDIGSTTVDIIPLQAGSACPLGLTDRDRLVSGELVYTGGTRTPLAAVLKEVMLHGETIPVAAEFFSSMQDVYLLTSALPESFEDRTTADGKPANQLHARRRLARMICADADEFTTEELLDIARQFESAQLLQIQKSLSQVLSNIVSQGPLHILLSGSCSFIAEKLIQQIPELSSSKITSLNQQLSQQVASAACAFAVAHLAAERIL